MFFEEWFKMMGGLKSIIEIGFAMIAIANFYGHASTMAKKIASACQSMLSGLVHFVRTKMGFKLMNKLNNSEARTKALKGIILNFVRLFSGLLLCLAAKLKMELRQESQDKLERLEEEYSLRKG